MKILSTLFFLAIASWQSHISGEIHKDFEGEFTIYTKHPDCEILKTQAIFSKDHSFKLFSTCNGISYNKYGHKNSWLGRWTLVNNNLVKVIFAKRHSIEFKILSDSLIELQSVTKFSKPKYKKE
jgi:hypothetical protein